MSALVDFQKKARIKDPGRAYLVHFKYNFTNCKKCPASDSISRPSTCP